MIGWFCLMNWKNLSDVEAGSERDSLRLASVKVLITSLAKHLLFRGLGLDDWVLFH
jgi:hypothetical protein